MARSVSLSLTVLSISVRTDVWTVTWCHITTLWQCFLSPADLSLPPTLPSTPPTPTTSTNTTRTPTSSSTLASPLSSERQVLPGVLHTGQLSSLGPAGTMSGMLRLEVILHPPPHPPVRPASTPPARPSTPVPPPGQTRLQALPLHQTTACPPYTTTNLPCPLHQAQSSTTRQSHPPPRTWGSPPVPQCLAVLPTSAWAPAWRTTVPPPPLSPPGHSPPGRHSSG